MPVSRLVITFFIMLSSSPMGLGGKLVVLSSLPVQVGHNTSVQRKRRDRSQKTAGTQQILAENSQARHREVHRILN